MHGKLIAAMTVALAMGGCSTGQSLNIQTASVPPAAKPQATRGTPVVSGRPARVYIMAGFKEADCSPISPTITIKRAPAKGKVTFKPGQTTSIEHSGSGSCTGKKMPGTGIYYTAAPGVTGPDSFEIEATTGTGAPTSKVFQVRVVE